MREAFRALRIRNYRLFFIGQTLSLIGTWMQTVAMSLLVYRITGSEFLLGTVAFCSQIPMFVVSPFAGIVADKHDRQRLLVITQSLAMLQALALAILVLTGTVATWHIIVLSVFIGIVNAYDTPARQAFVPDIIENKSDLPNAIALNSTQFNIARLIGPAVAGIVVAAVGEGVCFAINAVSYVAVIVALMMMRVAGQARPAEDVSAWQRLREGAIYAWEHRPIKALLQLMAITSLVSGVYTVLMPVFANEYFRGDVKATDTALGVLYAAVAVGALGSAWMLAQRRSIVGLGIWIVRASAIFNIGLVGLSFAPNFWSALPILAVAGFGTMLHMGATNTLIQTLVEDRMRGRVMAFYVMSFVGTMPVGSFLGGWASSFVGPHWTLALSSIVGLSGSLAFYLSLPSLKRIVRPIYEKMGLVKAS